MLSALTSCTGRPTCRAMRSMICSHTIMPCGWEEHRVEAAFKCCAHSAPGNEQRCNAGLGGRAATLLSACRPLSRASSVSNNAFHARDPIPTERHMCLTSLPCSTGSVFDLEPARPLTCGPPNPRNAVCEGRLVRHTLPWARSAGKRYTQSQCMRARSMMEWLQGMETGGGRRSVHGEKTLA